MLNLRLFLLFFSSFFFLVSLFFPGLFTSRGCMMIIIICSQLATHASHLSTIYDSSFLLFFFFFL